MASFFCVKRYNFFFYKISWLREQAVVESGRIYMQVYRAGDFFDMPGVKTCKERKFEEIELMEGSINICCVTVIIHIRFLARCVGLFGALFPSRSATWPRYSRKNIV